MPRNSKKPLVLLLSFFLSSLFFTVTARGANTEGADHPAPAAYKKKIIFAMTSTGCNPYSRVLNLIYKEAFSRLGYSFNYTVYPLKRSLAGVNAGQVDGECARFDMEPAQFRKYPNLIQVKEPVWTANMNAYSIRPEIRIDSWASLGKQKNVVVGYTRGILLLEQLRRKCPSIGPQFFYETQDTAQGIRMLASKRIEIFLGFERPVQIALKREEFKNVHIINAGPVDLNIRLFPYLHKKHAGLAVPLAQTLKQMKQEGTYNLIVHQVEQEVEGVPHRQITLATGFEPPLDETEPSFFSMASNIVQRAFEQKNYQVMFVFKSSLEAFKMAQQGQVTGTVFWRKTKAREEDFYISKPVVHADIVFFYLKRTPFDWHSLEDLSRFRAGIIRGLEYENKFDMAVLLGKLPATIANSPKEIFEQLLSGKIDYAPTILENGYVDLKKIFSPETVRLFTHHPQPLARHNFHLLLSKQDERNKTILSDFNQGLYLLKQAE